MRLMIRVRGIELADELREVVVRRVRFALSRLVPVQGRVDVTLADVNGPRGGLDKRCRIRVHGGGVPEVVVEETGADLRAVVDAAADRTTRSFARALARRRLEAPHGAPGA